MDKYYLVKGTIDGHSVKIAHILHNFRGSPEEAALIFAKTNPGVEDAELTENGDSSTGQLEPFGQPNTTLDFAPAMMAPPRTVKVKPPPGNAIRANAGVGAPPVEVVPAEVYAAEKAKAEGRV